MIKRYVNQSVNGPFSLLYHHNRSKWKDMLLIVIVINSLQSQKNDFTYMRKTLVLYIISLRSIDSQFCFSFYSSQISWLQLCYNLKGHILKYCFSLLFPLVQGDSLTKIDYWTVNYSGFWRLPCEIRMKRFWPDRHFTFRLTY